MLDEHWSIDMTVDGNQTVDGIDPSRVLNPLHPVASGGFIGGAAGTLTEDFTAITTGATFRSGPWSATGRAEFRAGDQGDRYGFTGAALRQIGEGNAAGVALNWFTAESTGRHRDADRPPRIELGAPARRQPLVAARPARAARGPGEERRRRPAGADRHPAHRHRRRPARGGSSTASPSITRQAGSESAELSLFWGSRYVSERLRDADVSGWSNVVGVDWRYDLSETLDVGIAGTVRHGLGGNSVAWSGGPTVGLTPFENGWLSAGWNFVGFDD